MHPAPLPNDFERQQVAAVGFTRIRSEGIHLVGRVTRADVPVGPAPASHEVDAQTLADTSRPLALNPQQSPSDLEDKVVTAMFLGRQVDRYPQPDRVKADRRLRDVALVV